MGLYYGRQLGGTVNGHDFKLTLHQELLGGYSGDQLIVRVLLMYCLAHDAGVGL